MPVPTLREYFAPRRDPAEFAGVRRIPIRTPRGDFTVWTKRFGHNPRKRVLLLHGGPGGGHELLESLEPWLAAEGVEFIYYDQLGSAFSDQPQDASLWTMERFVDEVEQVRRALGLGPESFFLLGCSWGGMLGIEYALAHGPNLKGLVVANSTSSIASYNRYQDEVVSTRIDPAALAELRAIEAEGDFGNPRYMQILSTQVWATHMCRLPAFPDGLARAFARWNLEVRRALFGPSLFKLAGPMASWDRSADLRRIEVPTLVIGATWDTMDPSHMKWMAGQLPRGRYHHCANGSHGAIWDDTESFAGALLAFLDDVDRRA